MSQGSRAKPERLKSLEGLSRVDHCSQRPRAGWQGPTGPSRLHGAAGAPEGLAAALPMARLFTLSLLPPQAGLIEANGELKVFIDQNLSPGKGKAPALGMWAKVWPVVGTPAGPGPAALRAQVDVPPARMCQPS